jgi:outer membrane protein insertion porin family
VDADAFHYSSAYRELQASVGLGLRLNLPIGPLRLDYGFPIKRDQHALRWGKFSFDVGYQSGF